LSATLPLPLAADLNTRLYAIDFQCEFLASPILVADADRFAGMSKELEKVPERLREPQIVNVAQEEGRIMFWAKLWISYVHVCLQYIFFFLSKKLVAEKLSS